MMRLSELMAPAALDAPRAAPLLAAYRNAVSTEEWGEHFNHQASPGAALALRELRLQAVRLSRDGVPASMVVQWFKAVDDLEDARLRRLFIGSDHTDDNQWWVVLVLFSIATTLALWQLAMHTNPYNGGFTRVTMPAYLAAQPVVNP